MRGKSLLSHSCHAAKGTRAYAASLDALLSQLPLWTTSCARRASPSTNPSSFLKPKAREPLPCLSIIPAQLQHLALFAKMALHLFDPIRQFHQAEPNFIQAAAVPPFQPTRRASRKYTRDSSLLVRCHPQAPTPRELGSLRKHQTLLAADYHRIRWIHSAAVNRTGPL